MMMTGVFVREVEHIQEDTGGGEKAQEGNRLLLYVRGGLLLLGFASCVAAGYPTRPERGLGLTPSTPNATADIKRLDSVLDNA
jgi:hypothetical protein